MKNAVTNSMEQSPGGSIMSSGSQEISLILWNPKVHYRIHKSPPPIPFLSQISPVHAFLIPFEKLSQTNIYENKIMGVLLLPAWKVEVCSDVMFYGNKLVSMSVEQSLMA
jgi:hypothetical protein